LLSPVGAAEGHTSSSPYPRLVHVRTPVEPVAALDIGESACAAAASIGRWVACSLSPLLHLSLVEDCRPADVTCFPCGALIGIRLDKSRAVSALGAFHRLMRRARGSAASGRSDAARSRPEPCLPSASKQTKAAVSAASSPNRYTPPTRLCGTVDGHRIRPLSSLLCPSGNAGSGAAGCGNHPHVDVQCYTNFPDQAQPPARPQLSPQLHPQSPSLAFLPQRLSPARPLDINTRRLTPRAAKPSKKRYRGS